MKTTLKTAICLLTVCLLTLSARAFVVLQDNFNYPNGPIVTESGGTWVLGYGNANSAQIQISGNQAVIPGTGTADQPRAYFTNGLVYAGLANYTNGGVVYISNSVAAFFPSNSPVAALYASLTVNIPSGTGLGSTYFAFFADTNFDYRCRLFVVTNGAASGNYRIGVASYSFPSPTTNIVQTDLIPGTTYTVAMRYILNSGISTVWVNPSTENTSDPTITATGNGTVNIGGGTLATSTCAFGLRNAAGLPNLTLGNLVVGTTFADVVPSSAGFNPPFIALQPQDNPNAITNDNVNFSTLAGGDLPLSYQWYSITNGVTNTISGASGSNLVLNAVATNQTGYYFAVVTNSAGSVSTRLAQLVVYPAPVAVVISNQPQSLTLNVGDTAAFSVLAGGVPPPTYQWYYVTNSGAVSKTNAIAGATSSTLTLGNLNTNTVFTNVFVTVANRVNTTNSALATLKVNPVQLLTIAQFRSMVDGSYNPTNTTSVFTIQGTVTTWTNMTGPANTEFYMQDSTAGIAVFWSGANSTNLPPAGAVVKMSAPMAAFDGLIEIEPVFTNTLHKVTVVSTGNPLPVPQPLPFDPNVTFAQLKAMESSYFVASNVTLTAGATFTSGVNEPITANASNVWTAPMFSLTFTNLQGEQFTMYLNAYTGIPGNAKPSGPVTIYGVLGYFNGVGFEFTPSRYADIISYIHTTNVLSHLTRPGDQPTNTFAENFLLPGGTLTTYANIGDPAGGNVTLTPLMAGLPASASWSNITNGPNGTAIFHFTPVNADSGSNYVVNLAVTSTVGTAFTNSFTVYVPDTNEQQIALSEFLANPATNSSAPNFNPLHRSTDTLGVATNDQYLELVNLSGLDFTPGWTVDSGNILNLLFDSNAGAGTTLAASSGLVIFGGNLTEYPNLPVVSAPATSLLFPTSGSGLIELRNQNGYIIDRVVYSSSNLSTNSSLSRFPTINGAFVPQAYVSTSYTTAGLQYDDAPWNFVPQIPTGVSNIVVSVTNKQAVLRFTAVPNQATTLWSGNDLTDPFAVIFGQPFSTPSGVFSVTNLPPAQQFYFITTQTNRQLAP